MEMEGYKYFGAQDFNEITEKGLKERPRMKYMRRLRLSLRSKWIGWGTSIRFIYEMIKSKKIEVKQKWIPRSVDRTWKFPHGD